MARTTLLALCEIFSSCIQRYALQCSSEGHFAQLIFGADLARAYRARPNNEHPTAMINLLSEHFLSFEEQCGTHVKTLAFFIRDLFLDQTLSQMTTGERQRWLTNLYHQLNLLSYTSSNQQIERKEDLQMKIYADLILDTLPRELFDRHDHYRDLLIRILNHNLDRIDDYVDYYEQLSFTTTGASIDQSRLIDGILVPIHNSNKLLSSLKSHEQCHLAFLDLSSTDESYSIVDHNQQFFSYDTWIYRQFIKKHLSNVNFIFSVSLLDSSFVFELHQAKINLIDTVDEQTFALLLKVYQCIPCNRLILSDDETIDRCSTILLDRYVFINQQPYLYFSSNGAHQTLLTCVSSPTLVFSAEKIFLNLIRLIKYLLRQLTKHSSLSVATEKDYLQYLQERIPEISSILTHRRLSLDRSMRKTSMPSALLPVCLFREYLLNGIEFFLTMNKIDGLYSVKNR